MEKTYTGLDDCLNMLLSCFRKKMSVPDPPGRLPELRVHVLRDLVWAVGLERGRHLAEAQRGLGQDQHRHHLGRRQRSAGTLQTG